MRMRELYPTQEKYSCEVELFKDIVSATNIKKLNVLRMAVIKFKSKALLDTWQQKFWELKKED